MIPAHVTFGRCCGSLPQILSITNILSISMKRLLPLLLLPLVTLFSCTDSTAPTTTAVLGPISVAAFEADQNYQVWYQTGFGAYPDASGRASFDSAVAIIRANFDSTQHTVVMAIKPNCGCQTTQLWMPRVMRALDAAGVPDSRINIYLTDNRLAGIDSIKSQYSIVVAPSFVVVKNGVAKGRINEMPPGGRTVEQELADAFVKP